MSSTDPFFQAIGNAIEENLSNEELQKRLNQEFSETCAILVLDSTGFTRVTQKYGIPRFLTYIYQLRKVGTAICQKHKAISWRFYADNMFAEFHNIEQAVTASLEIHQHFNENPIPMTSNEDLFGGCIGIGYGKVLRSQYEGVYGDEMNLASKLGEDTAERGQTLLTQAAWDALEKKERFQVKEEQIRISGVDIKIYDLYPA